MEADAKGVRSREQDRPWKAFMNQSRLIKLMHCIVYFNMLCILLSFLDHEMRAKPYMGAKMH